jgi:hypothetical protein
MVSFAPLALPLVTAGNSGMTRCKGVKTASAVNIEAAGTAVKRFLAVSSGIPDSTV